MAAFVAVVDQESFSGAARVLGVSRSAVSRQISRLEETIATTLLVRTTRRLRLTPEGEAYYRKCQQVVDLARQASGEAARQQNEVVGPLRVTAPMVSHRLLMPIVADFCHDHPEVSLHLSYNDAYADLVGGGFDVALRVGPSQDSSLKMRKLFTVRYGVCASPAYVEEYGRPRSPKDLTSHRWITLSTLANANARRFSRGARTTRVQVTGSLHVDTALALRDGLLAGAGLSAFPLFYLEDELARGTLLQVLTGWKLAESGFYILYPAQEYLPARTRAFIDSVTRALHRAS